jgi:hypothetical protein
MIRKLSYCIALFAVFSSGAANAWTHSKQGTIQTFEVWADGSIHIALAGTSGQYCNVTGSTSSWVKPGQGGVTADSAKTFASTLMAYKLAGKQIAIYSGSGGGGTYCLIEAIQFL